MSSNGVAALSSRLRTPNAAWLALGGAACGCVLVALVDPTEHLLTPPCPFRVVTGWWCPFCGATRAASRLIRGDVASALRFNAVVVLLAPLAALMWVAVAFPERLGLLDPVRSQMNRIFAVVAVVFGVFMVVRNLPLADAWLRYPGA